MKQSRAHISSDVRRFFRLINADKVFGTHSYVLEVDGKFKSQYESSAAAMKVGLELKTKYPQIQVKVYDAKERTRTVVELTE